jgi:hypothetical protein
MLKYTEAILEANFISEATLDRTAGYVVKVA